MITGDMIKQAAENVYRRRAEKFGLQDLNGFSFHMRSFIIGLAVGLVLCAVILAKAYCSHDIL